MMDDHFFTDAFMIIMMEDMFPSTLDDADTKENIQTMVACRRLNGKLGK